jgi:hypothetical protein
MSFTIPIWLLWALGIVGGVLLVAVVTFVAVMAILGGAMKAGIGRGLNW